MQVFRYVDTLDAFLLTAEYLHIAQELGLEEWTPVVWLGRLFMLDNDYGEHWFDTDGEREPLRPQATALGTEASELLIIDPERMQNGQNGPCHSPELRKLFWTDVLRSLAISDELLFAEERIAHMQAWLATDSHHAG